MNTCFIISGMARNITAPMFSMDWAIVILVRQHRSPNTVLEGDYRLGKGQATPIPFMWSLLFSGGFGR